MNCPLCGSDATETRQLEPRLWYLRCPACGGFRVNGDFLDSLKNRVPPEKLYLLSALVRQSAEENPDGPGLCLTEEHLTAWRTLRKPPLPEEMDALLVYIRSRMKSWDSWVSLANTDYPLFVTDSPREFNFLLEQTVAEGYLVYDRFEGTSVVDRPWRQPFRLTTEGWERLAKQPMTRRKTDQAFVARWFTDEMQAVYDVAIAPALEEAGWTPLDLSIEHNDDIADRALAEIRRSALVIADCTGNRPSVLFEAGFALGLGISVVFTCSEESEKLNGLPFDTSHRNHILWTDVKDLRTKLTNRVRALYPGPKPPVG